MFVKSETQFERLNKIKAVLDERTGDTRTDFSDHSHPPTERDILWVHIFPPKGSEMS